MSIIYMDNFQFYGTDENHMLVGGVWSAIGSGTLMTDPDSGSSGNVLRLGGSGTRLIIPIAGDVHNLGFRVYFSSLPDSDGHSFGVALKDASNNHKYLLRTNPSGYLLLKRTNGCGTDISQTDIGNGLEVSVASSSVPVIGAGAHYHIEWHMNRTSGAYEIRVEGVTVISGTDGSVATGNNGIIEFLGAYNASAGSNNFPFIKDLFIADDGGSVNNAFIGPVIIYTLQMDGDVSNGWALSTGTAAWSLVDELSLNDADYVQADAALPAACIMTFEDLPSDVVSVRALQSVVRAWKTDGGDATLQNSFISDGSEDNGADNAPSTSARLLWDVSELDPDTAGAWSPEAVNAATLKLNRTS